MRSTAVLDVAVGSSQMTGSGWSPMSRSGRLRSTWWSLHRWIGIGLAVLLVPVALSGALLVWHDEIDTVLNPARYAVSGAEVKLMPGEYLASVASVIGPDLQPIAIRYPRAPGWPVTVMTRQQAEPGQRPRFFTFFLDPPTGKVLDKINFRASFFGFLHVFHENLTVPEYSGRAVVGWGGVGMLVLSLTGIWLWWPRNGAFLPGLRWRRSSSVVGNLHHLLGFWISIPLAVVSATGIYLSFPPTARSVMSSIALMGPQQRPSFAAEIVRQPSLTAGRALELAQALAPQARPGALFLPSVPLLAGQDRRSAAMRGRSGGCNCERVSTPSSPFWSTTAWALPGGNPIRSPATAPRNGSAGSTRAAAAVRSGSSWCS